MPCTGSERLEGFGFAASAVSCLIETLADHGCSQSNETFGLANASDVAQIAHFEPPSTGRLISARKLQKLGASDSAASCQVSIEGGCDH